MEKSQSIKNLAIALCTAQSEFEVIPHDANNPFYKSKYATLGATISATVPIMKSHGLVIIQFPFSDSDRVGVETMLLHESGEWLSHSINISLPTSKNLAQEAGKAITYLRRYGWQSVLGVYSGDDDDAQSFGKKQKKSVAVTDQKRTWSPKQLEAIVNAKAAKNAFNAKAILDLSNLKSPNAGVDWCAWYGKAYRKARESGLSVEDAAERVNASYIKTTEIK